MKTPLRLPEIEVLQNRTRSIYADSDPFSLQQKLSELFRFYEIINFNMESEWPIWRVRKCDDEEGYLNLRDLTYPPPEHTRAGRLNNPGLPVLYTSLNNLTAITEIGAEGGDYLHIIGFGNQT